MSVHGDRLVVVGGSIGGLIAARVLSDHFAEVTIVERGGLPDSSRPRRGVPQTVHLPGLTLSGRLALDQIYGNVATAELIDVEDVIGRRSGPTVSQSGATEYRSPSGELLAKNVSRSFCKPRPGHRDSMTVEP